MTPVCLGATWRPRRVWKGSPRWEHQRFTVLRKGLSSCELSPTPFLCYEIFPILQGCLSFPFLFLYISFFTWPELLKYCQKCGERITAFERRELMRLHGCNGMVSLTFQTPKSLARLLNTCYNNMDQDFPRHWNSQVTSANGCVSPTLKIWIWIG